MFPHLTLQWPIWIFNRSSAAFCCKNKTIKWVIILLRYRKTRHSGPDAGHAGLLSTYISVFRGRLRSLKSSHATLRKPIKKIVRKLPIRLAFHVLRGKKYVRFKNRPSFCLWEVDFSLESDFWVRFFCPLKKIVVLKSYCSFSKCRNSSFFGSFSAAGTVTFSFLFQFLYTRFKTSLYTSKYLPDFVYSEINFTLFYCSIELFDSFLL